MAVNYDRIIAEQKTPEFRAWKEKYLSDFWKRVVENNPGIMSIPFSEASPAILTTIHEGRPVRFSGGIEVRKRQMRAVLEI